MPKKRGDEPHIHYFPMGPWPIYVGFTQSRKAFAREMKRLKVSGVPFLGSTHANATTHFLDKSGALTAIITLGSTKGASTEQVAAMIAHEAVHVAQELWVNTGEKRPGAEAEAYLVQHVTQACLSHVFKSGLERRSAP